MSWVPSACPCAVSSPTYIAKGSCPRQEDQGAPIPQQGPSSPACSVHWLDSWPRPLWRKCVHLPVPCRILLWVITPRRAPCPQPTQPPINTCAFRPMWLRTEAWTQGREGQVRIQNALAQVLSHRKRVYMHVIISPRARTELNKYASDHLITNTLHTYKCFLATHWENLKTLKQPPRLHWTLVTMLLCWFML